MVEQWLVPGSLEPRSPFVSVTRPAVQGPKLRAAGVAASYHGLEPGSDSGPRSADCGLDPDPLRPSLSSELHCCLHMQRHPRTASLPPRTAPSPHRTPSTLSHR